jgi:hypothetical protein
MDHPSGEEEQWWNIMKMHRCTVTLVFVAAAWNAAGQTAVDLSRQGKLGTGTTLPVHCTVGQVFFKTDAPAGANLYACTTSNNWSVMGLPPLGGDASGTQQSITVKGIQGRAVSVASPADQNVLRWNAATGQWEPGPVPNVGSANPPGSCIAGSLYLRNDLVSNIQQLYVCSNTDTWTMASIRSGPAASRPANCVAGQTWLSTDTAAMAYCSVTGNPGTWSAISGPQGPAGPPGPAGTSILSGYGAPSAATGNNGDFYLSTSGSCLYGPKAAGAWPGTCTSLVGSSDYSGVSGNSKLVTTHAATGMTVSAVEGNCQNPNSGSLQASICYDFYQGGLFNPASYGNLIGIHSRAHMANGYNAINNSNKNTMIGGLFDSRFNSAGQRNGLVSTTWCYGVGDCQGVASIVLSGSYITAPGDEANVLFQGTWQTPNVHRSMITTGLTLSTCAVTALAASVAQSTGPTDYKTVPVSGATTNCAVGDWLTVDNGVPVPTPGGGNTLVEVIQINAKTSNSITALFKQPHSSYAPVAPSPVLISTSEEMNNDNFGWGQNQWAVDMTATPYTTGTASVNASAVTGVGTSWTDNMVGGNAALIGCISFDANTVSISPFNTSPARMWYPIIARGSGTTLTLLWDYFNLDGASTAIAGNYIIRPCARIGGFDMSYGTTSSSISGVVLESNAFPWSTGHTVEQAISPRITMQHGILCNTFPYTIQGAGASGDCFVAANNGNAALGSAFTVDPSLRDDATHAGWVNGLKINANTSGSMLHLGGHALNGYGIYMPASTTDPKKLHWENASGLDSAEFYPGATGSGLRVDSSSGKLAIGSFGGFAGTLGTANLRGNVLFNFPAEGAGTDTLCTMNTGCGGGSGGGSIGGSSGSTGNAIIRANGSGGTTVQSSGVLIGDDNNLYMPNGTGITAKDSSGAYRTLMVFDGANGFNLGGSSVAALNFNAASGSQIAFNQGADNPLLIHHNNRVSIGGNSTNDVFTALFLDTIHTSTNVWIREGSAQSGTALSIQNAAGVEKFGVNPANGNTSIGAATFDPSALTAARTITLPNVGGTPMLYQANTTGSTAFAPAGSNCPATNCVTPYTWMQVTTADGSTAYMPVFK